MRELRSWWNGLTGSQRLLVAGGAIAVPCAAVAAVALLNRRGEVSAMRSELAGLLDEAEELGRKLR